MLNEKWIFGALLTVLLIGCASFSALDETYQVDQGGTVEIELKSEGLPESAVSYTVLSQPPNGELTGAPQSLLYKPNSGFVGTDSFRFEASASQDDQEVSDEGVITIVVNRVAAPKSIISSLLSLETKADYVILELSAVFDDNCGQRRYLVLDNSANEVLLSSLMRAVASGESVELVLFGCVDIEGGKYPKLNSVLMLPG